MRKYGKLGLALLVLCVISADYDAGSGIFGKWIRDRYGLVAYQYEMDQRTDPRAKWQRGKDVSTLNWHQLGNLRVNAVAANEGFVQLFYNDSAQVWLNNYDPKNNFLAGGFGFILDGDTSFSTLYSLMPKGASMKRTFGQGYFEKETEYNGLRINEIIFAPAGDIPALVMIVKIKNTTPAAKEISYIARNDPNPLVLIPFAGQTLDKIASQKANFDYEINADQTMIIGHSRKIWGKNGGYPPRHENRDPEFPDTFFGLLDTNGKVYAINRAENPKMDWTKAETLDSISSGHGMSTHRLGPSEEEIVNVVFGYAKAEKPEDVIAKIGDPDKAFANTLKFWQDSRPSLALDHDQYLSRELEWDNYYLVSSFLYDAYYDRHFAPQGGHYLYVSGVNGASRDLSAYILALIYYHPELAREMLELCFRSQETSGRFFYDFEGYGKRYAVPYRPSDLSLWIIWAATEYVFATRDFAFLQKELPYWPKEGGAKGTVLDHLNRGYHHLERRVGVGRHGLIKLKMSDWNDQMTLLVTRNDPLDFLFTYSDGESVLNTAMACYILPRFAQLLNSAGDGKTASEVDKFIAGQRAALSKQWLASGWFPRAYSALGKSFGKSEMYLEPQVWALLSEGVMTRDQQEQLVKNIDEKLRKPSKLGMMISNATKGSLFARPGEQERGGIWFAINASGAVALSKYDPEMGYDELKKNSLAVHAMQYPELWFGVWSGPDSFNSVFSKNPGGTWYATDITGGPSQWPVQNNHSHADFMWALARIAGFEPTAEGFNIRPSIPQGSYKLDTGTLGLEKSPGRLAGYFKFDCAEWMLVTVTLPQGFGKNVTLKIDGKESTFQETDHGIKFPLSFSAGKKTSWELTAPGK